MTIPRTILRQLETWLSTLRKQKLKIEIIFVYLQYGPHAMAQRGYEISEQMLYERIVTL